MAGFKESSPALLACVLVLMIVSYLTLFLRIYVRLKKKAWGADDWCMAYAAFPWFIECLSGILGAYWGLGQHESILSAEEIKKALLWWNIFSFFYCNSTLPIKLGIAFQLRRIAGSRKPIVTTLYVMMALNSLTLAMVFIFQLSQCTPVAYNWDKTIKGGHCLNQKYLTIISYVMSGINITTDWICACLPIPLLWNVQMNTRKKIIVGLLLGVGVLGSIAALVRLKYTVALSDATDFTFTISTLACWTIAEPGLGYIAGNAATLRPLFKKLLKDPSSRGAYDYSSTRGGTSNLRSQKNTQRNESYFELDEDPFAKGAAPPNKVQVSVVNKRNSSSSMILRDDNSGQRHSDGHGNNITVSHEVEVTHEVI